MPETYKLILIDILLGLAMICCMGDEPSILTDWGRTYTDWQNTMYAIVELGNRETPAFSPQTAQETEGYAAYLKAMYLTAEGNPSAEAAPEVVVPLLTQAIDAFPELPQPVLALSAYRNGLRQGKELIADLAPLAERHPDSVRILQNYAAALLDENQFDQAEPILDRLTELAPRNGLTLMMKGNSLLQQERYEELRHVIQKIDELPESEYSADHVILQLRFYAGIDDHPQAIRYAERLVELPEVYSHIRFAHLIPPLLNPLKAWELQRRFSSTFWHLNAEKVNATTLKRLCDARLEADFQTQNYEDLAVCLEQMLQVPNLPYEVLVHFTDVMGNTPMRDSEMHLDADQILQIDARAHEARMLRRPQDPEPRRALVLLYFLLNAPQKALTIQNTIPGLQANDQLFKARILASMKRYDEALAIYQQFESHRQARNSAYYLQYGCTAEENGETERALRVLRQGVKYFPNDASLANSLGYILADHHQDMDEAKELIERAIQAEPDNPAYLDSLAWVHYRQGNLGLAIEYMAKCLQVMDIPAHDLDQEIREHLQTILQDAGYSLLAEFFDLHAETK